MSKHTSCLSDRVDRVVFWKAGANWRFTAYDRALDLLHDVVVVDDNATEQQALAELERQWPDAIVERVAFVSEHTGGHSDHEETARDILRAAREVARRERGVSDCTPTGGAL